MALKRTRSRRESSVCTGGLPSSSLLTPCHSQPPSPDPSPDPSPKRIRVETPQAGTPSSVSTILQVAVKTEINTPECTSLFGSPILSTSPTPPLSPPPSPQAQTVTVPEKLPYADLPSGGRLFQPAMRQVPKFVNEIRVDLEQPMHTDMIPRGFSNPSMLCYRNAVVTALLNTNRFLAFLHAHMRQTRRFHDHPEINSHLLTRLYHLAVAYWERDGRHPMEPRDTYERLLALFWRACRTDVDESDRDVGKDEVHPDFENIRCWLHFCNENQNASVPLYRRQQDASDMMHWLVDACENQLSWWPAEYGEGSSLLRLQHMFKFKMTNRYVCTSCQHPIRLRRPNTEVFNALQINICGSDPRPGARVQRLFDYMEDYFNDSLGHGYICERCHEKVDSMPCLKRLQSTPEILNVQLCRMHNPLPNEAAVKNCEPVDIPQFLDVSRWLEPHVYGTRSRIIYRLSAVISHKGTGEPNALGHYAAFVRKPTETQMFQKPSNPVNSWAAVNAERELQNSIYGFMRAHGHANPAPGQASSATTPSKYDDQWPLPDVSVVREQEARDNEWVCISDTNIRENVPYRKIINTSRDFEHTVASPEWFDPAMLVYEKWIEEFHTNSVLNDRVFQQPMNQNIGQDMDTPLPEKRATLVVGETEWLFEKEIEWDHDEFWNTWYGEGEKVGNEDKEVVSSVRTEPERRLDYFLHLLYGDSTKTEK